MHIIYYVCMGVPSLEEICINATLREIFYSKNRLQYPRCCSHFGQVVHSCQRHHRLSHWLSHRHSCLQTHCLPSPILADHLCHDRNRYSPSPLLPFRNLATSRTVKQLSPCGRNQYPAFSRFGGSVHSPADSRNDRNEQVVMDRFQLKRFRSKM